jgi:hypothetical protein
LTPRAAVVDYRWRPALGHGVPWTDFFVNRFGATALVRDIRSCPCPPTALAPDVVCHRQA